MGLNNPKPVQSWCVILQTFSKKSRKEFVGELVQGFGLDEKEASDAIGNLPIVVVDQLNLNQAKAIKEKLEVFGAVIEITNHDIIKKQCYRIEWPTQPNLAYFEVKSDVPSSLPPALPFSVSTTAELTPQKAAGTKSPLAPKPFAPVAGSFSKPPTVKNTTPAALPKKSWFPFGPKKPPLELPKNMPLKMAKAAPAASATSQPRPTTDAVYQPKAPVVDINQNEWQKRTQEIQTRLEKMGAIVPESTLKPSSKVVEKMGGILPLKPTEDKAAAQIESTTLQEKYMPVEKKQPEKREQLNSSDDVRVPFSGESAKKPDSLANQSHELLEKIQKLEHELTEKKQNLEQKHADLERRNLEMEQKHLEVEEVKKVGSLFSEKVGQLEKALTEKESHLNAKHSELEQKSEKERSLTEMVAQLESRLADKAAELESRKQEILQVNAQFEEGLKTKDQELELIQGHMQEIAQKFQVLEQGIYEKQDAITRKESEIQSKDQKIQTLQVQAVELEKKALDAQSLEKDKEQQVVGAQAREKDALKKVESLEKALVEMGEALRQRDESLRQRDEVLVALERRVQDLAEKTGSFEALKAAHSTMQEEFEDVAGKYNRLSEEFRRFRSKNERKAAALTREMGEWVRKVDHLRQGLQKFNQSIVRPEFLEDAESDSETPPSA